MLMSGVAEAMGYSLMDWPFDTDTKAGNMHLLGLMADTHAGVSVYGAAPRPSGPQVAAASLPSLTPPVSASRVTLANAPSAASPSNKLPAHSGKRAKPKQPEPRPRRRVGERRPMPPQTRTSARYRTDAPALDDDFCLDESLHFPMIESASKGSCF